MTVLAHISDPHFGTEQPPVVAALIHWIAEQAPALVVLSGDITQRARGHQFAAAKAFIERLTVPVLTIPGNHDIALFDLWSRFTRPYARFRNAFGRELEPVWESPQWLVIGVNTTRRWRHTDGEVSRRQIARVAHRLRGAQPGQRRIVVTHQPMLVTHPADRGNLLRGHAHAARAWSEAGADLLLGGHIHLPYVRSLREDHPQLHRQTWVVQAGTALSHRVRGGIPNSVNLLRYGNERDFCEVERWDYAPQRERFERERRMHLHMSL